MDSCEPDGLYDLFCFLKFVFGLAGKTGQDICRKSRMRKLITEDFDAMKVLLGIISTPHTGEYGITAGLKGQMKLRTDFFGFSQLRSEIACDDCRFKRT